ncbi:MAG: hypothetical protein ACR2KQ_02415 [Actinomycetota bacterium]
MKKIVMLVLLALVAAALVPGPAVAGKKKKKPPVRQEVSGHIALQAPPSDATSDPNGCYSGVHRRIAVATQEQVNGVVGFHFDVDPETWNKKFRLTPAKAVDIDITFYTEFGTLEQATDIAYAPPTVGYAERNTDGEFGKIPPDMNKAIVCMKAGEDANFDYVGGDKVK